MDKVPILLSLHFDIFLETVRIIQFCIEILDIILLDFNILLDKFIFFSGFHNFVLIDETFLFFLEFFPLSVITKEHEVGNGLEKQSNNCKSGVTAILLGEIRHYSEEEHLAYVLGKAHLRHDCNFGDLLCFVNIHEIVFVAKVFYPEETRSKNGDQRSHLSLIQNHKIDGPREPNMVTKVKNSDSPGCVSTKFLFKFKLLFVLTFSSTPAHTFDNRHHTNISAVPQENTGTEESTGHYKLNV